MEDDQELKLIEKRKLEAMMKRASVESPKQVNQPKVERSSREVVEEMLYDRGVEVLEAAYSYFPAQTPKIVDELARMIKNGRMEDKISGGELYSVLRQLGLRFSLKTSIKVQDRGRLVDLSEKLMRKEEG